MRIKWRLFLRNNIIIVRGVVSVFCLYYSDFILLRSASTPSEDLVISFVYLFLHYNSFLYGVVIWFQVAKKVADWLVVFVVRWMAWLPPNMNNNNINYISLKCCGEMKMKAECAQEAAVGWRIRIRNDSDGKCYNICWRCYSFDGFFFL